MTFKRKRFKYGIKNGPILFKLTCTFLSQCIVWTTIYISSITLYSCSTQLSYFTGFLQIPGEPKESARLNYISTLTYVAYLWNGKCKRGNATKGFDWPDKIPSSERTYKWMFAYSIITSCWIPASVGLIIGAFYARSKDTMVCMSLPWLFITSTLTVMDLAAAVMYTTDIFQMMDKHEYLQFIGVGLKNTTIIEGKTPQGWQHDTIIPGFIFVMIYFRLIFIWFINVYLLAKIFNEVRRIRTEERKESQQISQNFEMSIINRIQDQQPSSQASDRPATNDPYMPWMDVFSFKTNVSQQSLKKRRNSELSINTKIADEYNQAKLKRLNEEFRKKYLPIDKHLVKITGKSKSPDRMRRRHSEEYTWREKVTEARRFSEQQHQIKVIAEILEQKAHNSQSKVAKQAENERRKSKTKEPINWYEPIWEMETADSNSHYTTIENDLYSPVFDYLGQPASHLQPFQWSLESPSLRKYKQRIILNYPINSPTLQENNPLRRIWNEIQVLKYGPKPQTKPPPSPQIDYEL